MQTATEPQDETNLTETQTAAIIAQQNDAFRRSITASVKAANVPPGKMVMTAGIAAEGDEFRAKMFSALVAFDDFNEDADPYGLHEMGVLEIEGQKVWFKFDLYDENYEYGAETPTDPKRTRRVLTLLFPSEY